MEKNYSRQDLTKKTATVNQMRNIVYHLMKYMEEKGDDDKKILQKLKRMGKNIAATENTLIALSENDPQKFIKKIYNDILGSKVLITVSNDSKTLTIDDKKCAMCKYHRKDIKIAPCELITSMVMNLMILNGFKIKNVSVTQSKSLGDLTCNHEYIMEA